MTSALPSLLLVLLPPAQGLATINAYDALDRLVSTVDGSGILTEFEYDSLGNRTLVRDGRRQTTRFTYDGLGRNISIDYPPGVQDVVLAYNAAALRSRSDGNGLTQYACDPFNRLRTVAYPGGATRTHPARIALPAKRPHGRPEPS